ncbi:MAG: aconitase family protein, partial [Aeromicrobium sp.]
MSRGTMTAQILERHGIADSTPGTFALLPVDRLMVNDVSGAVALKVFEEMGATRVHDPAKVSCIADHFWPAKDAISALQISNLRSFADRYGISDYYEVGATVEAGIEHALLAQLGQVTPGSVVVGGDSHTCTSGAFGAFATGVGSTDIASVLALGELWIKVPETHLVSYVGTPGPYVAGKDLVLAYLAAAGVDGGSYAALEFDGPAVRALSMDHRMALCNMAVEGGAKTGMVPADDTTLAWLASRNTVGPVERLEPLPDAEYDRVVTIDVDGMGPLVAMPYSPGNVVPVGDLPLGTHVDQVYVG